jgi:hypothetical protein
LNCSVVTILFYFPFFPFLNAVSKLCHVFVWELVHYPCEAVRNKNRKNFLRCALKRKASAYFVLHIAKCAFKNQEKVFFFLHKNSSCWWNKANGRYKCKCEFLSIVDDWKISVYRNHLKFMKWDSHKNFSRNAQCAAEEEQKNKKKKACEYDWKIPQKPAKCICYQFYVWNLSTVCALLWQYHQVDVNSSWHEKLMRWGTDSENMLSLFKTTLKFIDLWILLNFLCLHPYLSH